MASHSVRRSFHCNVPGEPGQDRLQLARWLRWKQTGGDTLSKVSVSNREAQTAELKCAEARSHCRSLPARPDPDGDPARGETGGDRRFSAVLPGCATARRPG